jgi:hypothetical protein
MLGLSRSLSENIVHRRGLLEVVGHEEAEISREGEGDQGEHPEEIEALTIELGEDQRRREVAGDEVRPDDHHRPEVDRDEDEEETVDEDAERDV